jgi:DNA-directed RNA polymerase specialized sigma subunit
MTAEQAVEIEKNLSLVSGIVFGIKKKHPRMSEDVADALISVGTIGLIKAVKDQSEYAHENILVNYEAYIKNEIQAFINKAKAPRG